MEKTAKDLVVGDKLKAGSLIAEVETVRIEVIGSVAPGQSERKTVYIKIEGQPEIADWNLQKYIDQGSIGIL